MIVKESFYIDGEEHIRTYSDIGMLIASDDGTEYEVAEDLAYLNKEYHETGYPVSGEEATPEEIAGALERVL